MSMLNWLGDPRGHRNRVKQLEACNAKLAERNDWLEDERIRLLNQVNDLRTQKSAIKQYAEKLEAERDATAKMLEETTANLIDAKRKYAELDEEFTLTAKSFDEHLDELEAAEQLLDEAGESIRVWRNAAFSLAAKLVVEKHCR